MKRRHSPFRSILWTTFHFLAVTIAVLTAAQIWLDFFDVHRRGTGSWPLYVYAAPDGAISFSGTEIYKGTPAFVADVHSTYIGGPSSDYFEDFLGPVSLWDRRTWSVEIRQESGVLTRARVSQIAKHLSEQLKVPVSSDDFVNTAVFGSVSAQVRDTRWDIRAVLAWLFVGWTGGLVLVWVAVGAALFCTRHKSRQGLFCPECDYDRTGIATDAVCPECGKAP